MLKTLILNGKKEEYTFDEIFIKYKPYLMKKAYKAFCVLEQFRYLNVEVSIEIDDLFQEFAIVFYKTFIKYDIDTEYAFTTFMMSNIDGYYKRIIRDTLSARNKNKDKRINRVSSLDNVLFNDDGKDITLEDKIAEPFTDTLFDSVNDRIDLGYALKYLSDIERKTVDLYHIKNLTQNVIADKLDISQVQVSRLLKRGTKKIKSFYALNESVGNLSRISEVIGENEKSQQITERKSEKMIITLDDNIRNKRVKREKKKMAKKINKNLYNKVRQYMLNNETLAMAEIDFYAYAGDNGYRASDVYEAIKRILSEKEYIEEVEGKKIEKMLSVVNGENVADKVVTTEIAIEEISNLPVINTTVNNNFVLENFSLSTSTGIYTISECHIDIRVGNSDNFITMDKTKLDKLIEDLLNIKKLI